MENNTQNVNVENEVVETAAEVVETAPEVVETAPEVVEVVAEETSAKATAADFIAKAKDFAIGVYTKVKDFCVDLFGKIKADPKGLGVKLGAIVLGAIVVIVGLCVGISVATNNYKTPIRTMQKYANTKKYYDSYDEQFDLLNGFCEKESKKLVDLMKDSEAYDEDSIEDAKDDFKDYIQDLKDEYGKNYKYTYKVIDKEKLDKDELKEYRDDLRDEAEALETQIENSKDFDSDDWEDIADSMGFDGNKSKAKKYYSILKDVRKVYKSAKVTAGYDLTVEVTLTGSELDEPETYEIDVTVLKVNGRWVPDTVF